MNCHEERRETHHDVDEVQHAAVTGDQRRKPHVLVTGHVGDFRHELLGIVFPEPFRQRPKRTIEPFAESLRVGLCHCRTVDVSPGAADCWTGRHCRSLGSKGGNARLHVNALQYGILLI